MISGVYGGGGNAGATFTNDFIEIFNLGANGVSLSGMSLQYASSAGDFGSPIVLPNVTIAPGKYFLVQGNSAGAIGVALPPADMTSTVNLSATNGKMALASVTTALACGGATRCNSASIVDMVGWGTATDFEGPASSAVAALSATSGAYRKLAGCTDSDVNKSDFDVATPVTAPRNQATTAAPCGGGTDAGTDTSVPDSSVPDTSPGTDSGPPSPGDGNGLAISQVFGGSGSSRGFVEIFNRSLVDVGTRDLSIQVATASAEFGATPADIFALPDIVVPIGAYILVGLGPSDAGAGGLPATDLEAPTLHLDAAIGKVVLAKVATALGCGGATRCSAKVVDLVGYGSASDFETVATAALSATSSASRKANGCTDTNENQADFTVGAPTPRNIVSKRNPCRPPTPDAGPTPPPGDDGGSSLPPVGGSSGSSGSSSGSSGTSGSSGIGTNPPPDGTTADTGGCNATGAAGQGGSAFGIGLGLLGLALARRRRRA